jgi:hypothetical protein
MENYMKVKHFAVVSGEKHDSAQQIPESNYAAGHIVTAEEGTARSSFRLTGIAHHEQGGPRDNSLEVRWLAERIDLADIDPALTKTRDD